MEHRAHGRDVREVAVDQVSRSSWIALLAPTRTADVVSSIRADLIRGLYGPSARLKEGELAERYAASRTPVREALRTLARAGLLHHRPQAGYVVATLSLGDMDDLYSIRVAIEEQVASRIVELGDLSAFEPLESFWSAEPPPPDTLDDPDGALVFADEQYHEALAEVSGSSVFPGLLRDINARIHVLRARDFLGTTRVQRTFDQHSAVLRALRARDRRLARALLRSHIWESHGYVREAALAAGTVQP